MFFFKIIKGIIASGILSWTVIVGGQPRLKKEVSDPLSHRNAPGSRKCGCTAKIKCRLLETDEEQLLEVTLPLPEVTICLFVICIYTGV